MAVTHISETEAARDFFALLARLRTGEEFIIESGADPVARLQSAIPSVRTFSECLALIEQDSPGIMDEGFASAVQEAIDLNQQPFEPPSWD